jgi:hypothetical protein
MLVRLPPEGRGRARISDDRISQAWRFLALGAGPALTLRHRPVIADAFPYAYFEVTCNVQKSMTLQ